MRLALLPPAQMNKYGISERKIMRKMKEKKKEKERKEEMKEGRKK